MSGVVGTTGVPGSIGRVLGKVKMVRLPWETKKISMERTSLTLMDTWLGGWGSSRIAACWGSGNVKEAGVPQTNAVRSSRSGET